jgi:His-Xaa-Ser system radical SAM maturase HxsC
MKQLQGISQNITETVIGKITHKKRNLFQSKMEYMIISDISEIKGYAAILTDKKKESQISRCKLVHSISDLQSLWNGDIVAIYPNGDIKVLYEITSAHNSLFLTERCNANCIMCPQPPNNQAQDNFKQVLHILSLMDKRTKHIGITGGEPTLLGDKLFVILKTIKSKIPKASVTLLTNAIKLSDFEYAKRFSEINHHDLLIDVPIYSDTDTEHNKIIRANGFYKSIKGLYNLAKINQKVGIRIVIHMLNYKRLPQIAEFIYRNFPFVIHIAFMQMEPIGYARDHIDQLWIDPHDYNSELEQAINFLVNCDLNVSIYNSQLCILPDNLRAFARQSISTWKNIYLDKCSECDVMTKCPGFFASSIDYHSNHIKSIKLC